MTRTRRPIARPALAALVALGALGALAVAWPSGAFGTSSSSDRAQQLVERTHQAAESHDFAGVATVSWRDHGVTRRVQVDVTDSGGTVEARAGGSVVYDSGSRTYLKDGSRWTSIAVDPATGDLPGPGSHWRLTARTGAPVAGRSTTEVVATRRSGTVAQRLFVDDATGLVLRRDVLDRTGALERSLVFSEVEIGPATTAVTAPEGLRTERSSTIAAVPDGYVAPSALGEADLVARAKQPDGVLLYYSDGLFSTSVFEQRGSLDWSALPDGGTTTDVRGTTVRQYSEPSATVLVWERDGVVYTCVSDAPDDVFTASVGTLTGPGRSAIERAADFVLGPFGWS